MRGEGHHARGGAPGRDLCERQVDGVLLAPSAQPAAALRHLAGHGHRRIALVSGLPAMATTDDRLTGYRLGLTQAGLPPDDALVVGGSSNAVHARAAVLELFAGPDRPDRPTGLVVSNNHMMIGAVRALRELGLDVPGDVAVVGFDHFEWADLFSPRLTTMAQPETEIGVQAVRLLLGRLRDPEQQVRTLRLTPTLVARNSSGCADD